MNWKLRQRRILSAMRWILVLMAISGGGMILANLYQASTGAGVGVPTAIADSGASILCLLLVLAGTHYGLLGWHQWSESRLAIRGITGAERHVMSVLRRISESHRLVYGPRPFIAMLGLSGMLATVLLDDLRWLGLPYAAGCLLGWLWVRTTTPPLVLFLSTSDSWSIDVHGQLKDLACPLRVVTLLDLEHSREKGTADVLRLDCLRTGNDDDWWKVITILMKIAPLLVINADTESPGVVREARHLVMENMTHKVLFLTRGDACLLRCEPEPAASSAKCQLAGPGEVAKWILANLDQGRLTVGN